MDGYSEFRWKIQAFLNANDLNITFLKAELLNIEPKWDKQTTSSSLVSAKRSRLLACGEERGYHVDCA
jgi:hypothetical protein